MVIDNIFSRFLVPVSSRNADLQTGFSYWEFWREDQDRVASLEAFNFVDPSYI
jgi:hypothetical protein